MARKCSTERAQLLTGGFATAKKNITIQYQGRDTSEEVILSYIRNDVLNRGLKDDEITDVDIYIKPEEKTAYYVVNKEIEGSITY